MVITGERRAKFRCPGDCRRTISVHAAYPFMSRTKTCPGCRSVWTLVTVAEDWTRAEPEAVGVTRAMVALRAGFLS